jgi:hypothetical protein
VTLTNKPTPEELDAHVAPTSTGLGYAFNIYCRYCHDAGAVSADRRTTRDPEEKLIVADKFVTAGWRIENGVAVCPTCVKKRQSKS